MSTQTLTTTGMIGGSSLPRSLFARVLAWLDEQRRYRRTVDELAQLSDRELSDIGLSRAEIDHVARRCAHCA
ncbi:MAG: DUF1127 domain-containing protein [Geminicoccaceae bacterium]